MKFAIKSLIAAAAMASMLSGAQAATFNYIAVAGPGTTYALVTPITNPLPNPPLTTAGALLSTLSGAPGYSLLSQSLVASSSFTFCVDLFQYLIVGPTNTYSVVDPAVVGAYIGVPFGGTATVNGWGGNATTSIAISKRIDLLMSSALPTLAGTADADALQFAIWEVIHDFSNPTSVTSGAFSVAAPFAITSKADGYLSSSLTYTGTVRHYSVLTDPNNQDVLIQVPEPMSASLVALGLLGASAARRRKPID